MNCRICNTPDPRPFLSLGETALANSYVPKERLGFEEKKFPLEVAFCSKCKLVQLTIVVPPELLFKHYLYVTSTSNTFKVHFGEYAKAISRDFRLSRASLAVDIGSNDGLLLKGFMDLGIQVVGVEPADNLAKMANDSGIETINDFFSEKSVSQIIDSKGNADVVTANNVFAHTGTIKEIAADVKKLLKPDGVFVIECAYLADMLRDMTFDSIYHEHLFYYSLTSLDFLFRQQGMQVFKVEHVGSHGGSLRVFVKKAESSRAKEASVTQMLEKEKELGMHEFQTYAGFGKKVSQTKEKLVSLIRQLKSEGKKIAGYGAPAKATTLLSFCGLGTEYIDYIVDDSPLKQGLYLPGLHIPIVSSDVLDSSPPDYIVLLAWNFAPEILRKTQKYADKGIKFIVPVPEAKIV